MYVLTIQIKARNLRQIVSTLKGILQSVSIGCKAGAGTKRRRGENFTFHLVGKGEAPTTEQRNDALIANLGTTNPQA